MEKRYLTCNLSQTKKLGKFIAQKILKRSIKRKAVVLGLVGDLGGGKTTLLQGFARGLGIEEKILSPTFVIMRRFRVSGSGFQNFYHIDCYRIQKPKEILNLSFKGIISNPKNIVAIEWADRIKKIIPKNSIWMVFKFINNKKREIVIK